MKKIFLPLLALPLLLLTNCGSAEDTSLPLIERNEEVKTYFETVNELVDEYIGLVDVMLENAIEMKEKEDAGEAPDIMDGLGMLSDMGTSVLKISELSSEIEKMEDQKVDFEKTLSADDMKEFLTLYANAFNRFTEMAEKYSKLDD